MAHIVWTDDDLVDPYPAILETLEKVFHFATTDEAGNCGISEVDILRDLHIACMSRLAALDRSSIPLLRGNA